MTAVRSLLLLGALALGLVLASGCQGGTGPNTGSETHFLEWCSSAVSCGEGLDCRCGVCTKTCADTASCLDLAADAECVAIGVTHQDCAEVPLEPSCEVACDLDDDCALLGDSHRCDRGFCRRLAADCARGQVSGSDVVLIGDSFLAEARQVTPALEAFAREAGALGAQENYRDYSSMRITSFGGAADLTTQYATARAEGPMRIVIMDAGGPDALNSCPEPLTETCPSLQNAVAGASALWSQMAADGVEVVVDFFYPDPADATLKARFDVLRPLMRAACEASPVRCYFLDLRPTFEGRSSEYLLTGGLLPTSSGSAATAAAIWSLMEQRCVAQ